MTDDAVRQFAGPMYGAMTQTNIPMAVTNPRLRDNPVVFVNRAFTALTGYEAQEVRGKNLRFLQGAGTAPETVAKIQRALRAGRDYQGEILNYRKDGTPFWTAISMTPVPDDTGKPAYFLATHSDPARNRQLSETVLPPYLTQLSELDERLQLTLSICSAAAAWEWDFKSGRILGDARFAALYGLTSEQASQGVSPKTFFSIIHPDDQVRIRLAVGGVLRGAEIFNKEYRILAADGSVRWIHARGLCRHPDLLDGAQDLGVRPPLRFNGVLMDITDQKRVEEQLRIAQTAGGIGTFEYIDGFATVSVSAQFCNLLGLHPASDLPVRTINAIVHPQDPPLIDTAPQKRDRHAAQVELRITRPNDGAVRWLTRRGEYLSESGSAGVHFVGVIYDVTEAKHIEVQLRNLNETLEQRVADTVAERRKTEEVLRHSQKMDAVGQLTGGIAHDFNNLLTGITGSLDMLSTRLSQGRYKDVDKYILAAQGAAKRAAALTHRLLAFSRRQTLDPKSTDANRLVADMEELVSRTVGPAIELNVVKEEALWSVLVDPNQLENALLNLCINARDAMPDGGKLTIATENRWLESRAARDLDLPPGPYVTLCVTDTGTGMEPDVINRAFEPFFTTKPLGLGTGLGLSMIFGFVQQSGGQVKIDSRVGHGTTMCLYLPRYTGAPTAVPEESSPSASAPAGKGETVLVLDDEPTIRMLIREVLEELGYKAFEAEDSMTGLKLLRSDLRIDLLVTDVGLPGGLNGRQVADAGRLIRPGLKVLFITGYAEAAMANEGQMEAGMHILPKPFTMEALAGHIKTLITGVPIARA
ncbi:MAG: PAS domain-containing protein [Beijerinckiaceae bacterium]|nr:PAS domain-containing protein [Beijerinckiaceae bacterium]